jgi:predicted AAA+ superfamily ATPase
LIVKKLAESVMQPLALARILGIIKSAGCSLSHNTLVDYLQYLNDAYLIFGVSNYSNKLSERENIKKRYFFDSGLYYYNKNTEVDFYIPEAKTAIQVSYTLSQSDTREREVKALLKLAQVYPLDKLQIVTWEEEAVIDEGGHHIEIVPILKWMLE